MDVASIPCWRFQKGILTGVLNTELDDVVIELLFTIFFISVHHSAGRRHMTPVDQQQFKDQTCAFAFWSTLTANP